MWYVSVKFHEIPALSVGKPSVEMLKGMKVAELTLTEMMSNLGFRGWFMIKHLKRSLQVGLSVL